MNTYKTEYRKELKNNHSDEVAIYLTPSELRLVKMGVKALHEYENIIDEGHKFTTTEQTEYIKEIQKVSKFKLEK
ncbi:TPA: hypothetical protein N2D99_002458 [Clostridium botulinum]|nr:hypothetical protein [Clostridium botulinum]